MNMLRVHPYVSFLLLGLCASVAGAQGSPSNPVPTMRAGPAVWIEEYWDVKPEHFDEFFRVYKRDVYALARKVPG